MDTHNAPRSVEKRKSESAAIEGHVSKQARTDMAGDVHVQNGTQMPVQADVEKISQNLKYLNQDQTCQHCARSDSSSSRYQGAGWLHHPSHARP